MNRTLFRFALIYLCVQLFSAPAQTPAKPTSEPQTVLKAITRMVQVNVVVHARKGEPVTDLKKEDFTIYDQGQEQKVESFSMESAQPLVQAGNAKRRSRCRRTPSPIAWSSRRPLPTRSPSSCWTA